MGWGLFGRLEDGAGVLFGGGGLSALTSIGVVDGIEELDELLGGELFGCQIEVGQLP